MRKYVGALDQGTTSTRFMVFDNSGSVAAIHQREHEQIHTRPGWVEHDPLEIWARRQEVIRGALAKAGLGAAVAIMAKHEGWERGRAANEVDAYVGYAAWFRLR